MIPRSWWWWAEDHLADVAIIAAGIVALVLAWMVLGGCYRPTFAIHLHQDGQSPAYVFEIGNGNDNGSANDAQTD